MRLRKRCGGTKPGITHPQRHKDISPRKLVERQTADAMHNFTQRDVIDVAVNEFRAGRISQRFRYQSLDRLVISRPAIS